MRRRREPWADWARKELGLTEEVQAKLRKATWRSRETPWRTFRDRAALDAWLRSHPDFTVVRWRARVVGRWIDQP